jgi:hypothetical protein
MSTKEDITPAMIEEMHYSVMKYSQTLNKEDIGAFRSKLGRPGLALTSSAPPEEVSRLMRV